MKTWQMIFHASKIPKGKDLLLKFSFISKNGRNQTETYEINMKKFNKHFKTDKQYVFSVKLKDIGQPEQIRLKMQTKDDDEDEDDDDIKWQLDHVNRIVHENFRHSIYIVLDWINWPENWISFDISMWTMDFIITRKISSHFSGKLNESEEFEIIDDF